MTIKNLFAEVFQTIDPYLKGMDFLILYRTDAGDLTLSARNKDGRYIRVTPKEDHDIQGSACLGKLSYLKAMLDTIVKQPESEVVLGYGLASDKRTNVVKTISANSSRMRAVYQTMDPLLNQAVVGAMKPFPTLSFPVNFVLDKELVKGFSDALKVIKAYENPEIVRLELEDGTLSAYFEVRGDSSSVHLVSGLDCPNISGKFSIEQIDAMFKLGASWPDATIGLSDKVIRLSFSLEHADYMFLAASKKLA